MNEQLYQSNAKKILGLVGYTSGLVGIVAGTYLAITNKPAWMDYIPLVTSGFVVFFLADIMQSAHNRMQMLLRIIKHQETLLRQTFVNGTKQNQTPPMPENMKNFKIISPEDLIKTFNDLGTELQKALDEQDKKTLDNLTIDELGQMIDEALEKEDYNRAAFLRDVIEKRQDGENQ